MEPEEFVFVRHVQFAVFKIMPENQIIVIRVYQLLPQIDISVVRAVFAVNLQGQLRSRDGNTFHAICVALGEPTSVQTKHIVNRTDLFQEFTRQCIII